MSSSAILGSKTIPSQNVISDYKYPISNNYNEHNYSTTWSLKNRQSPSHQWKFYNKQREVIGRGAGDRGIDD